LLVCSKGRQTSSSGLKILIGCQRRHRYYAADRFHQRVAASEGVLACRGDVSYAQVDIVCSNAHQMLSALVTPLY